MTMRKLLRERLNIPPDARLVPYQSFGSFGIEPADPRLCPLAAGEEGGPSCQSGSGSSICGGYWGTFRDYVICREADEARCKSS